MDADTYFSQRLEPQLAWLGQSSRANKAAYLRYRLLGISLGALITILSPYAARNLSWNGIAVVPLLLQICGAGVALSGALLALNQHQENWLRYRNLKEALEREKWLYNTGSIEAYDGPDGFHRFVCTAEALMGQERATWLRQSSGTQANPNPTDPAAEPSSIPHPQGTDPQP